MLDELGTYSLSDFLLFSQETYFRLFELYNREVWPAHVASLIVGLALLGLVWRSVKGGERIASALLAIAWVWVAWAFHLERYATINPWATYLAVLFFLEAVMLLVIGLSSGGMRYREPVGARRIGLMVLAYAVLVQPMLGLASGRTWLQLSTFGIGPDPTAAATLGFLLGLVGRGRWLLFLPALAWCLVTLLTSLAMDSLEGLGAGAAAVLAVAVEIVEMLRARRAAG